MTQKIVFTVIQRSERDVTKSFNNTDFNWAVVEKQLILWADLYHKDKKLRVNILFNYNYIETSQLSAILSRSIESLRPLSECLPREPYSLMQNKSLLASHLLGCTCIILCVVLGLHVVLDPIAGVILLARSIMS